MKKILVVSAAMLSLMACQKEMSSLKSPVVSKEDLAVGTDPADSVIFYDWNDVTATLPAYSGRYSGLFVDNFRVTDSTNFYFKKAVFKLRIGTSVKATKARLYVDGNRNTVPLVAFVTGDSIVFENKAAQQLTVAHVNPYEHYMNMEVLATGDHGDSMRARLIKVIVIKKEPGQLQYQVPQTQITGLPDITALGKF